MSARSPAPSWYQPDWSQSLPLPPPMGGGDVLRCAMMLERCFDGNQARWSDALVARMRRHIGGCVASVEMALRLELEARVSSASAMLDGLTPDYCWGAVQRRPSLLGASLARHFRDRAALSLMQQAAGQLDAGEAPAEERQALNPAAEAILARLSMGMTGWHDNGPDHMPLRADLPAEMMQELTWTVAALLADALASMDLLPAADAVLLLDQAGQAVLHRHDEQDAPLALASMLAHRVRSEPPSADQLIGLAREHHILAALAIIADRVSVELSTLVTTIVEGPEQLLFQLCRAADFPREVAVRIVLGRRCIARGMEDSLLIDLADRYDAMAREDAWAALANLSVAEMLRSKLYDLRAWKGGHGN